MNYEEYMLHYGVKGMKWGVRRTRKQLDTRPSKGDRYSKADMKAERKNINQQYRDKKLSRSQAMKKRQDNIHKYYNENDKSYNKAYNKAKNKGRTDKAARERAMNALQRKIELKTAVGVATVQVGAVAVKAAYNFATSPEAARMGKNIVLAAQRSNIRYPGPGDIKNVIN